MTLPATAVLDFNGPAALWSDDRSRGIFNGAAAALLGLGESDCSAGGDLWLERVHSQDRHRVMSAWQNLQCGPATMVCSYRFMPRGRQRAVKLQETSRRLPAGLEGEQVVLSHFEIVEGCGERDAAKAMRSLIHQIGNNLQSIRGEADLLRLSGGVPQESFETIVRGIENIHRLTAQLNERHAANTQRYGRRKAPSGAGAAPTSADVDEV